MKYVFFFVLWFILSCFLGIVSGLFQKLPQFNNIQCFVLNLVRCFSRKRATTEEEANTVKRVKMKKLPLTVRHACHFSVSFHFESEFEYGYVNVEFNKETPGRLFSAVDGGWFRSI